MLTWILAGFAGCVFIAVLPWLRPRAQPSPGSRRLDGVRLVRNTILSNDISASAEGTQLSISIFLPLNRVIQGMESRLEMNRQKLRSIWSEDSKFFSKIWFRSAMERRRDFLLLLLNELTVALEPYFCSNRDCRLFASEVVRAELLLAHEAAGGPVFFEQHVKDLIDGRLQPHFAVQITADPSDTECVGRFIAVLEGLCALMYLEQVLLRYHRAEAKQRVWFGKWTRSSIMQAGLIGFVAVAIAASIFYIKSIYHG